VGNVGNQKQIAHMTHSLRAGAWGAGRVWVMWAMWAYPPKLAALDFMHGYTFYAHKIEKSQSQKII
jgi:putative copper export protein